MSHIGIKVLGNAVHQGIQVIHLMTVALYNACGCFVILLCYAIVTNCRLRIGKTVLENRRRGGKNAFCIWIKIRNLAADALYEALIIRKWRQRTVLKKLEGVPKTAVPMDAVDVIA